MIYAIILGLTIIVGSLFQQFWIGMGAGLVIDLLILLWLRLRPIIEKRRSEKKSTPPVGTAGGTPAVAGAPAPAKKTTSSVVKWVTTLTVLSVVGYLGWSIYNEKWWPGEYIAEVTYTHHDTVEITSLTDQRVCLPGLKAGNWYLSYPDEVEREHRYNKNLRKTAGFYVAWPGGQQQLSFTESVWINGIRSSVDEKVHVEPGGCFTITPKVAQAIKGVAVIYGNPRCATPDYCIRSTTPAPAQLNIFFSGRKVPRQ